MKFAASLTATGLLGFLLLEALKILLAPLATWLLGVAMIAAKVALFGLGITVLIVVSVFAYRRYNKSRQGVGY